MSKRICTLYTETTGLHQTNQVVNKKILYKFARMVVLNYEIGYYQDNAKQQFISEKKVRHIVKPRAMYIPLDTVQYHGITQEIANESGTEIEIIIEEFKNDIKNVDVIVSHNVDFHLKTILAEIVRYNIMIDLSKYIIIDTVNFFHKYGYIKLKDLALKLNIKISSNNINNVDLIKNVFLKLYEQFKETVQETILLK